MTKDVLVNISGLQMAVDDLGNEDGPIEIITPGTYYFKDGNHYIFMEEVAEGIPGVTKTQIRVKGKDSLEVIKKGISNTHMIFEKNKTNRCYYNTPFGQLNLGIATSSIVIEESEDNINIRAEYSLDVNFDPLAECTIRINIKPQGAKDFSFHDTMEF
jgi:uncharacterized beta-barrel protein YwiB (DUF1934 family)